MFLELDGRGPRYAQLIRALKDAILDGRLHAGSRLPPTRELAQELGLSRTTVLTAYEQLRAEGYIEGKVGSGSYVANVQREAQTPMMPAALERPSRFAQRLGKISLRWSGPRKSSLRYNLEYRGPLTNLALSSAWSRELAKAARYTDPGYPELAGSLALREAICEYLARRRGVQAHPDDILIVNGSQQALSLIVRVLLDEGDMAVLEEPAYHGFLQLLTVHGMQVASVRTDAEGLVCDELPPAARCVFVTPTHQFPGGSVLSLQRRLALLAYARAQGAWIIEDDYDGEFRYDVLPLAALRSLDTEDRVIYLGSFSKSLFPALRLGYMVLPASLRRTFMAAKCMEDSGSSSIEQEALANFIANGGFDRHLRQAAKLLKSRRAVLLEGLRRYGGERIEVVDSHAGMHLVVWFRDLDHAQCTALIERARENGLGLHAIAQHYVRPPERPGLMLSYASISVADLPQALRLFGQCLDAFPAT